MIPNSRASITAYALRALGDDVVEVNVSEDQLDDRLDEALSWFRDYHSDGVEKVYFKHQVTCSSVKITTANAESFSGQEIITGGTSGVQFVFESAPDANTIWTRKIGGTLVPGETLTGGTSGTVATLTSLPAEIVIGDIEKGYLPLNDAIISVVRVLPLNQNYSGANFNMFDVRYQIMLNDMFSLTNINMLYYTQVQSHLSMINFLLTPEITYQFNRHKNQLQLNVDWQYKVNAGDWMIVETWSILDPENWTKVYNDRWLKEMFIALIKRQWGNNLKKFEGMQLPGGVMLNGQKIFDEATAEIENLKQRVIYDYQEPVDFLIG